MTDHALATTNPATLAPAVNYGDHITAALAVLERAARDTSVDVNKLERLLAIQRELLADESRRSFYADLAKLQAEVPRIAKNGLIKHEKMETRFAKLEDIDRAVRPLCEKYGFAFTFDSKPLDKGWAQFTCTLSHKDGHSETKSIALPIDTGPGRNNVQAMGSTVTYARRYLLEMHLHLIREGVDDDGTNAQAITRDQADFIRKELATFAKPGEAKSDAERRESLFLKALAAASVDAIPAIHFQRAINWIDTKRSSR